MSKVFQAVRLNDIAIYNELILFTDVNILNENNQNLLQEALAFGNTLIGMDLIQRGIDVNHRDRYGQTPLHYCGLYKNPDITKAVLVNRGNPNIKDIYGNNALWTSVFNARGNYEIVKMLVENGGDVMSKNASNRSPLDFARQINDQRLIEILVNPGWS